LAPYALEAGAGMACANLTNGTCQLGPLRLAAAARASRQDALKEVVARTPVGSTAVLASTGFCGRELYAIEDRPNQLYMVGSMGCIVPLALGLALARPDLRVVALDGDGAALMRMGAFATVGTYGPPNLSICCWITAYMTQPVAKRLSPQMCHLHRLRLHAATLPHSKLTTCPGSVPGSMSLPSRVRGSRGCSLAPARPMDFLVRP